MKDPFLSAKPSVFAFLGGGSPPLAPARMALRATGWLSAVGPPMPFSFTSTGTPASRSSATPSAERFGNSSKLRFVAAGKRCPVKYRLYTPKLDVRLSVSMFVTILVCRSSKLENNGSGEFHLTSIELPASSLVTSFDNVNPASSFVTFLTRIKDPPFLSTNLGYSLPLRMEPEGPEPLRDRINLHKASGFPLARE